MWTTGKPRPKNTDGLPTHRMVVKVVPALDFDGFVSPTYRVYTEDRSLNARLAVGAVPELDTAMKNRKAGYFGASLLETSPGKYHLLLNPFEVVDGLTW